MEDSPEALRAALRRESAEADAQLRQIVRAELTPERLQADWDKMRGADQPAPRRVAGLPSDWAQFLSALWFAHVPQRMALVACAAAVLLAGWFALRPGVIQLRTPAGWQLAGVNLPRDLRLLGKGRRVELRSPTLLAAANLEAARSGATSDLRAYDVHLEWQTATGEAAVFSGTLVITNAPGAPPELSQRNIRGAVLTGDLKIGTQPWRPYSQPYTP